ncbi:hypothetical protein LJC60_02090 [Ruminococcaceae bacterium OttesenSCG-928-D13]|nr:hypothetical protein [Ruminococcaceae bacterium OttesenSCG-928-D13]
MSSQNVWGKQLIDAISYRHSVRTFLPGPLDSKIPEKINDFFGSLELPFPNDTKLQVFNAEPGKKLYNNGVNPVDNLAFISQTDLVSISKTGFTGEIVMLYAVSLGLSTCWFGHYKLSEVGRYIPGIAIPQRLKESTLGYGYGKQVDVGERVICCMPFGTGNDSSTRLIDKIMKKKGGNRKPLEELLESSVRINDVPQDIKDALELAKRAPSAGNSQMWRFGYDKDARRITLAKPIGYKHFKWEHADVDIGMCAAHLWLGLLDKGYSPKVEVYQDVDRAFWSFLL